MNKLGGVMQWGATPRSAGRMHLDPGVFVDQLFDHFVVLANDLMRFTPVEKLKHVQLLPAHHVPPIPQNNRDVDMFAGPVRNSVRWQLGF